MHEFRQCAISTGGQPKRPPFVPGILSYLNNTPIQNLAGTSLTKRIEQYLYITGTNQRDLAKQIGIDEASIRRAREGKRLNKITQQCTEGFIGMKKN